MTKEEIKKYWKNSSDRDFITMENLFKSKDYSWILKYTMTNIEKIKEMRLWLIEQLQKK